MKSLFFAFLLLPIFALASDKHPLTGLADEDFVHIEATATITGPLKDDDRYHTANLEVMVVFEALGGGLLAAHDYIAFSLEPHSVNKTAETTYVTHDQMVSARRLNDGADEVMELAKEVGYTSIENPRVVYITGPTGGAPEMLEVTGKGSTTREINATVGGSNFKINYTFTHVTAEEYMDYVDYCHSPWRCQVLF